MAFQNLWQSSKGSTPTLKPHAGNSAEVAYQNANKACIEFYHIASGEVARFLPLDIEYSENLSSEWNHVSVYGRNDPLSTFQGTKRTISLTFTVAATGTAHAIESNKEIGILMSLMYPTYAVTYGTVRSDHFALGDYNNASHIQSAPLLKVHFNNLIVDPSRMSSTTGAQSAAKDVGLVCSANGVQVTPIFDDGALIMGPVTKTTEKKGKKKAKTASDSSAQLLAARKATEGTTDTRIYPKVYKISTELTVYHTFPLGFQKLPSGSATARPHTGTGNGFGRFPWGEQHVKGPTVNGLRNQRQ